MASVSQRRESFVGLAMTVTRNNILCPAAIAELCVCVCAVASSENRRR